MMIFFLSTCYLDLDLAGSGFGSCYLRCVCMCFIVQCIWLHFVQLVMAHDLCSVNIKSVTFLCIFMAFFIHSKIRWIFFLFFGNQSNVRGMAVVFYSIWFESTLRFSCDFSEMGGWNVWHYWLTKYTASIYCFVFFSL